MKDPNNEWDVRLWTTTSDPAIPNPWGTVTIDSSYSLTCGGARTWPVRAAAGNFLYESYPLSNDTWKASAKDHFVSDPATMNVFAIGLKPNNSNIAIASQITSDVGPTSDFPSAQVNAFRDFIITRGGAQIYSGSGYGNLLTASNPIVDNTVQIWRADGKAHMEHSLGTLTVYAIGHFAFPVIPIPTP